MSRCLPFSPEALSKRRSSHEALIKLQKEKVEINTMRRREKNLKKNLKKHGDDKPEKRHNRPSKQATKKDVFDDGYAQMAMSDDSNSVKSDITEEFRLPTYSTRIGNIPDRTEITFTNKRKRQEESTDGAESKKIILRFRLPLKKHSAADASLTEPAKNPSAEKKNIVVEAEQPVQKLLTRRPEKKIEEEAGRTSKKPSTERPGKKKNAQVEVEKNENVQVEAEKPITKRLEKDAEEAERPITVDAKKHKSRRSKRSSTYKMLIEDWAPPSIDQLMNQRIASEDDEDDWLFGSRRKQEQGNQDQQYCLNTGLWPQATHFPEVDIYALPYTILF